MKLFSLSLATASFMAMLIVVHATGFANSPTSCAENPFLGNWALKMPDGSAGWLKISNSEGELDGELWTVGGGRILTDLSISDGELHFVRKVKIGKPEFAGGPPTGKRIACQYKVTVDRDRMSLTMFSPQFDGQVRQTRFTGKRMPPIPPKPDLRKIIWGKPVQLFNGRNLEGWELTNSAQINGWKAIDGELVNVTEKLDFSPYSRFGNLQTKKKFKDFNLKIEFKVPAGGNSGIYLRGVYEVQVLDRDSRMQGIQGVGAIFGRIKPERNAGKPGELWNSYDITLVDRHVTVILNGDKVIDNQPIAGCTNGAIQADETLPGPLYLQGDHTAVRYRNIILTPIQKKTQVRIAVMETAFNKRADVTSFKDARDSGFKAIQMHTGIPLGNRKQTIDPQSTLEIAKDRSLLNSWKKVSRQQGVQIVSLCAGSLNRCQIWGRDRQASMRIAKQTIDACHELGVGVMLFPFFGPSNFQTSEEALSGVTQFMKELLPHARKKQVVIGIEAPVTTVRVMELLRRLEFDPNIKIYYDTGNLFEKENIYETIKKYGRKHFCEIHIKGAGNAVAGKGKIDLGRLAAALDDSKYDKWLVYESNRHGRKPVENRQQIERLIRMRKSNN